MSRVKLLNAVVLPKLPSLCLFVFGCGGLSSPNLSPPIPPQRSASAVSISPQKAAMNAGNSLEFTATSTGPATTDLEWLANGVIQSNSASGTISRSGLYTAAQTVPSGSSVVITARSKADLSDSASANVTLLPMPATVTVSISPPKATVQPGQSQQFTATVTGTDHTGITWLVNDTEGGSSATGTISSTGVYSAPQTVPAASSVTMIAKSSYSPTSVANAVVRIVPSSVPLSTSSSYYVSPYGSNHTGNGSLNNPWATLSFTCSHAKARGDIIHISAGTYTDNAQCVLAPGVKIQGASSATATISSTANPYISAVSAVPTVDGSNEITGIKFIGGGSNGAITSTGRSNQLIHDNVFNNFPIQNGVLIQGKAPVFITTETTLTCHTTATASITQPNALCAVEPGATEWATGVQIYNNTATNTSFIAHTLKGAKIHDNTIDNSANPGVSAFGHTAFFWNGVDFFNNTLHINRNTQTTINLEVWQIQNDTKFHDNVFDGWCSLILNTGGISTPYSFEVYNNDFSSNVTASGIGGALEIGYSVSNVRVSGNFIANTGGNNTYTRAFELWGSGLIREITYSRNVIYNINGAAIEINSTFVTAGALLHPAHIANVYIYNNAFDTMGHGYSSALLLSNDASSGTLQGVIVENNIITNVSYGVNFYPPPQTMSGNVYSHNVINMAKGNINELGLATFTIGTTYNFVPGILASGDRWKSYYAPSGPNSNLVEQGTNVGLSPGATAPDLGPGYSLTPPATRE